MLKYATWYFLIVIQLPLQAEWGFPNQECIDKITIKTTPHPICGKYIPNQGKCHILEDNQTSSSQPSHCFLFSLSGIERFEFLDFNTNDSFKVLENKEICFAGSLSLTFPNDCLNKSNQKLFFLAGKSHLVVKPKDKLAPDFKGVKLTKYPQFNNYQARFAELYAESVHGYSEPGQSCGDSYCITNGSRNDRLDMNIRVQPDRLDSEFIEIAALYSVKDLETGHLSTHLLRFPREYKNPAFMGRGVKFAKHEHVQARFIRGEFDPNYFTLKMTYYNLYSHDSHDVELSVYVQSKNGNRYWLTPNDQEFCSFSVREIAGTL